jgi:hypothetical protein
MNLNVSGTHRELLPELNAEHTSDPESIDFYFQGRACLHKGLSTEHGAQARGFLERALARDPGNIDALVGQRIQKYFTAPGL